MDNTGYAVYLRLSRLPSKKGRRRREDVTVERQLTLIRKYAADEGIPINEDHIYIDNGRGAWKRRRVLQPDGTYKKIKPKRPDWDRMLGAGRRGEFPGIFAWKLDRFSRNMHDALDLCEIAEDHGLVIDGPDSGRVDLNTTHGRKVFRDAASDAEHASDLTSDRVLAAHAELIAEGLQMAGGRAFGFEILRDARDFDDDVQPVINEKEAGYVCEVARRRLAGETWPALAAWLNSEGMTTTKGSPWDRGTLARTMKMPRYGGRVTHHGRAVIRDGKPVRNTRQILDEATYLQLQASIAGDRQGRKPSREYPLSGVLVCGRCGRAMSGHMGRNHRTKVKVREYVCSTQHGKGCGAGVRAEVAEEKVRAHVLDYGRDADTARRLADEAEQLGEKRAAATAEAERLLRLITGLDDRHASDLRKGRPVDEDAFNRNRDDLYDDLAAVNATIKELNERRADRSPAEVTAEVYDAWDADEKRECYRQHRLQVTLLPPTPGAPRGRPDPDRVQVTEP